MSRFSRLITIALLTLTLGVLVLNARYLYVAPVANAWTWWQGDETWLMSEYKEFLTTGHFVNPNAPGSVYAVSSGLIFGSCYLTAAIYGLPMLLIGSHSVAVGRTITWLISICTLLALWWLAKGYQVRTELRAFGVLLLSSTLCFFLTSHSARYDVLVGLSLMVMVGLLPRIIASKSPRRFELMGALGAFALLICGHILILSVLLLAYAFWIAGVWSQRRLFIRVSAVVAMGMASLFLVQVFLLHSFSLTGPFIRDAHLMPFYRFFHPKAQLSNVEWRLFIARLWSPGPLYVAIVLLAAIVWSVVRYRARFGDLTQQTSRLLTFAGLLVLASIYIEYSEPRYLIFVLPTIVLSFTVVAENLLRVGTKAFSRVFAFALGICALLGVWHYEAQGRMMGTAGEKITDANAAAMKSALLAIHEHAQGRPRVFASIPAEAVAMDDSCTMLTSLIYSFPADTTLDRRALWNRANIEFGIFFNTADRAVRNGTDSILSWSRNGPPKLIYQAVGPLTDIERPYDPANLQQLDTLRVYEYRRVIQADPNIQRNIH